ncbi:helix-turn-helix transcriptional regulator [Actinoplanes sp. NPDC049118]|uniref:helix-turn-helix domain-containing protein n=1 Tax=Actinoplanes sp. NPDC049118 TaxID=3155769 RepID=UPI0033F7F2A5
MSVATEPAVHLTPRRQQTLQLVADGYTDREIADQLDIGERTAITHVRELRWLLGARNRAHAVALGYELGLLGGAR